MWNSPQRTIDGVKVLIRPAQPGDVEGLARAARDLAEQYAELEPDRFHVPEPMRSLPGTRRHLRNLSVRTACGS
jgi:hypothetical protein